MRRRDIFASVAGVFASPLAKLAQSASPSYWKIGNGLSWRPGESFVQGSPYLQLCDYGAITNSFISTAGSRQVRSEFNQKGAGYHWGLRLLGFSDVGLPDSYEAGAPGLGRGLLGSIRDQMHTGHYNPTASGRYDELGVSVNVVGTTRSLLVPQFPAPLFSNGEGANPPAPEFVFTAQQSEFDNSSLSEDATALFGLPAISHKEYWAFARAPAAITQFLTGKTTQWDTRPNTPVFDPTSRINNISPTVGPNILPANTDLSWLAHTPRAIRPPLRFAWMHMRIRGAWKTVLLPNVVDGPNIICNIPLSGATTWYTHDPYGRAKFQAPDYTLDLPFVVISTSSHPNAGIGMAIYAPLDDPLNAQQMHIVNTKTMQTVRAEDRRMQAAIIVGNYVPPGDTKSPEGYHNIAARNFLSGMLSPASAAHYYRPNHIEILTDHTYTLIGTPAEVLAAITR